MNIAIWVVQVVLAALFTMASFGKIVQSREKLLVSLPWIEDFPLWVVRLIGISEILGAVALILPMLTGIYPIITPLAAAALGFVMLLAGMYHATQSEFKAALFNLFLLALAVTIAYGRSYLVGG